MIIDGHCHLTDLRWQSHLPSEMAESRRWGLEFFMQGGVDPAEWERQESLAAEYPGQIGLCFGLHPYFVAENSMADCQRALDLLAKKIHGALALGELGLDFRPHIMKESKERQIDIFEEQLELARVAGKPCVFHFVQCFSEAILCLNEFGSPPRSGMVHSFTGSWDKAQKFLERGLFLSIGAGLLHPKNRRLEIVVKEMPLEKLLLETDSPDQPPPLGYRPSGPSQFGGLVEEMPVDRNSPRSLLWVAERVAQLRKVSVQEVLALNTANFQRLFKPDV